MNKNIWPYRTPGIPDDMFVRGSLPMTKREVRVISLAQAKIESSSVIYDVGAGTGSFSVEAALCAEKGQVYAIEKESEGVELISTNANKFQVTNMEIIHGKAPDAIVGLPQPDIVFLGGSGGNLPAILEAVDKALPTGGRLVANAIILENINLLLDFVSSRNYRDMEFTQVSVAKAVDVGGRNMLKSNNPVCIISAEKI